MTATCIHPLLAEGPDLLVFAMSAFWFTLFVLLPGGVISALVHFFLSLPMRRRDRALLFLDLLETALQRGQPVEQAILGVAESRDRVMGIQYFLLAAHLEGGLKLGDALERTPRFLPPQVAAMLRAGEKMGNLNSVLPACRETLRVAPDSVHTTAHYMVALLMIFAPVSMGLMTMLQVFVVPKFKEVAAGMNVQLYPITSLVLNFTPQLVQLEALVFLGLLAFVICYIGGPGFVRWFQWRSVPVVDWLAWRLPWKQKGLQRTFSAMLAVLLDGGVPEAEAVRLAGDATANEICRRRAARVLARLQAGDSLTAAIRAFDHSGEFHWRLTNATHSRGGFLNALRGWHEALDARAFHQQEAATQSFTSGLIILNGLIVGIFATGLFGILIAILKGALLAS